MNCEIAAAKVNEFGKKIDNEVRNLVGRSDIDDQLTLARIELVEFSCVCFINY